VQLGQFATIRQVDTPTSIRHVNRLRSVTISAEPGEGKLVGDVQAAIEKEVKQIPLPSGYAVTYAGQGGDGGDAFKAIFQALGMAIILMYMLMLMLFGSLVLPLAVLMSLPLSVVGAFGAMALTHTPLTLFSLLGFAVLVGLVGKNAILLVDYTEILRARGRDRTEALKEAGPTRLRPIIMTTMSVMVALLPIASGLEEGSELLQAAAVVLIGGLLTSTLLTLVFVPAMYTIFDDMQVSVIRLGRWVGRRRASPESRELAPKSRELAPKSRELAPDSNTPAPASNTPAPEAPAAAPAAFGAAPVTASWVIPTATRGNGHDDGHDGHGHARPDHHDADRPTKPAHADERDESEAGVVGPRRR
jgi:HAE1 family hydrophobic/amphiphilic exporter-1